MTGSAEAPALQPRGRLLTSDPQRANGRRARALSLLALGVLCILPVLLLAPLFRAPIEPDQGVYATIARGWLHGSLPYRDLWDNKGPLLYLWYVVSFVSFGEGALAPQLLAAIVAGLTVPFVWGAARVLFGERSALPAAALFAFSFSNLYLQVNANAEVFMLLPWTAGLWAFAVGTRRERAWWFLTAGALTSLAVFTRQSALWAFVAYGAWLGVLVVRYPEERRRQALALAALALGAALGAAPFVAYFAAHGALYDLWYGVFAFNWSWSREFPLYAKLIPPMLWDPVPLLGGLAFWLLAAIGVWRLWLRGDRAAWLVLSFLACSEAAAQSLGKASPHYSVHLLPGAALAAAVGLPYAIERWRDGDRALRFVLAAATAAMVTAVVFVYAQPTAAQRFKVQYMYGDYARDALEARSIATAIASMTQPGDLIYEWGRESEIYFLADRQPATRWLHDRPYQVDPSMIDEVIADLERRQPVVILFTPDATELAHGDERLPPALAAYVAEHYRYTGRVAYAELYELRD